MIVILALAVVVAGGMGSLAPAPAETVQVESAPSQAPPSIAPSGTPVVIPSATPLAGASDSAAAKALALLPTIETVNGYAPISYDRDLFGQRWADVDRNGCDTRNDILARDLLNPVFKDGTGECKVLAGELLDPYDGSAVSFVSGQNTSVLVQIDHVVALAWAWHHGAYAWTDEQRTAFANDPLNLLASSQGTNQPKSASGPADWLPPVPELSCRYVERWVLIVDTYDLGIDAGNRAAAEHVLAGC